jgi:hypothetical protein
MTRRTRRVGTILLTLAALGYLVWQIDLGTTVDVLRAANLAWFVLAAAIMILTVPVLARRWGWLLDGHDIHERLPWLARTYYVANTAGRVRPTSLGGDAVRVVETTRHHPGRATVVTGTVLLERGLGGASTVALSASCSRSASTASLPTVARACLSSGPRPRLPLLRSLGAAPAEPNHCSSGSASKRYGISWACTTTAVIRLLGRSRPAPRSADSRILAIWSTRQAVTSSTTHLPRVRALLFLVMLVPFTLNGIAVRRRSS